MPKEKVKSSEAWSKASAKAKRESSIGLPKVELKEGSNVVRIVENYFVDFYEVYIEDTEGKKHRVVLTLDDYEDETHPIIKLWKKTGDANYRPRHRYYFNAIAGKEVVVTKKVRNKNTGKIIEKEMKEKRLGTEIEVLEVGPKIFSQLAFHHDDDEYPEINEATFRIVKEKTGSKAIDVEYTVSFPQKKDPLPEDFDVTGLIDLDAEAVSTPREKIEEWLGITSTPKSGKTSDKKKSKLGSGKKKKDEEVVEEEIDDDDSVEEVEEEEDDDGLPFDDEDVIDELDDLEVDDDEEEEVAE